MSLVLLPQYNDYMARNPDEAARDVIFALLVHTGIWLAVGASAGLAYGVGLRNRRLVAQIVLGGLAGAALGTLAYELIGAVAVPAGQTTHFISATWQTRLLARLAVTMLAAAGVTLAAAEPEKQTRQPAT